MGYGAFMNVVNNRSAPIRLFVTDVTCMYDNGESGSNLSLFDNTTVAATSELPGGHGEYIEVKASGSCFFESSTFTLKVEDAATATIIGHVSCRERYNNWDGSSDNADVVDLYINNSGDQAVIRVTVEAF